MRIKLDQKNIIKLLYLLLVVGNIGVLILLFQFLNKNVYQPIFNQSSFLWSSASQTTMDINVDRLEAIVNNMENKSPRPGTNAAIRNFF